MGEGRLGGGRVRASSAVRMFGSGENRKGGLEKSNVGAIMTPSTPFVSFPCARSRGVDHIYDRHGAGGLIDEVVEDVPHDGSGVDALSLEFANERKGVGVGLESNRAYP